MGIICFFCLLSRGVHRATDDIKVTAHGEVGAGLVASLDVVSKQRNCLTGFGISYFDMDDSRGYIKTATEVSSDNSALMRNIRRHENSLEGAIVSIARAAMHVSRGFGESIPNEGITSVQFDDSIIQDTAAEKEQDMREVGVTMGAWEYRMRWYGEEESVARERAAEVGTGTVGKGGGK